MEHVERQDEREQDIRDDLDDLEGQADELEQDAEGLENQAGDLREDFEQKQHSAEAPGIQEQEGTGVVDRPDTSETPGGADESGQATGNPPQDDSPAADED